MAVNANVNEFFQRVSCWAKDRGITDISVPSDSLDMSRDVIFDDAANEMGLEWDIEGTELRLWPVGITINWDEARKEVTNQT